MKNFKKLSRAEMKKVTGGGLGHCSVQGCSVVVNGTIYPGTCSVNCVCTASIDGGISGSCAM